MGLEFNEEVDIKAQAHLWNIIYGFADSLVLRSAVELGIADIIKNNNGSITVSELASKLPISNVNSDNLYRVLRYLVHMGILKETKSTINGGEIKKLYSLEPVGSLLVKDAERNMVPIVLGMTQQDFMIPWHYIKEGLGEGSTAFEKGMGMTLWEYLEGHPEQGHLFNVGMEGETRLLTKTLIESCKDTFEGLSSLVDVGGGNGTTIKAISEAFPHIKCSLYDLPHVVADSHDLPNIEKIPGDIFKFIPNAQAILLKLILHDWSDEDSVKILKKCREAVPQDTGRVIIVDVALEEESEHPLTKTRLVLDVDMLVNTGGRERSEDDWAKLLKLAGFRTHKIRHIAAVQSVIEAFP
uniref:3'-hydroxy-N-methylcoclaurine-4'-O-methyltransferase n=1 Tax=Eschscholzia californica TaxID=3467 RepID=J7M6V4_ESCCA|nr:3'-hydroxy-N-methylcoclaurine-4'-O-methyltransferase [Eschscholzia californica]